MKDELQKYLERECIAQEYAKKIIAKPIKEVKQINRLSIMSVKQKIKESDFEFKPITDEQMEMLNKLF